MVWVVVDFRVAEASVRLRACGVPLSDITKAAGLRHQSTPLRRLDSASARYRRPPTEWPAILARVALARVATTRVADFEECTADLNALLDELES